MYLRSDHRERLISLTYKELLEIEKEKKNRLIGKWIKEMNRQLPEKNTNSLEDTNLIHNKKN